MDKYLTDALNQLAAYKGTEIALIEGRGFLTIIVISLLTSLFISALYLYFYENRSTGSRIHRSFPLLGVSVTTLFVCIQFSLPLSLGLLGALSIVRFRTPIKEPEEIGFIMLVIAASIACAKHLCANRYAIKIRFPGSQIRWRVGDIGAHLNGSRPHRPYLPPKSARLPFQPWLEFGPIAGRFFQFLPIGCPSCVD